MPYRPSVAFSTGVNQKGAKGSRLPLSIRRPLECCFRAHQSKGTPEGTCQYVPVIVEATDHQNCVRAVSHTPRNPGATPLFTGTQRGTLTLREVVDENCVDAIWCASARASGTNFQACSFNHSDISPYLESTTCERSRADYRTRRRDLNSFLDLVRIERFANVR
jgi:hypothetical protein